MEPAADGVPLGPYGAAWMRCELDVRLRRRARNSTNRGSVNAIVPPYTLAVNVALGAGAAPDRLQRDLERRDPSLRRDLTRPEPDKHERDRR